jgi:hypothetical protein
LCDFKVSYPRAQIDRQTRRQANRQTDLLYFTLHIAIILCPISLPCQFSLISLNAGQQWITNEISNLWNKLIWTWLDFWLDLTWLDHILYTRCVRWPTYTRTQFSVWFLSTCLQRRCFWSCGTGYCFSASSTSTVIRTGFVRSAISFTSTLYYNCTHTWTLLLFQ